MLAARVRKLINARARKNKCTARMLTSARQDHSIPLIAIRLSMYCFFLPKATVLEDEEQQL